MNEYQPTCIKLIIEVFMSGCIDEMKLT
jgi:hypothetical protein